MTDLAARIQALEPAEAERILQTVARHRLSRGDAKNIAPDAPIATQLASEIQASPADAATAGELARAALLLLADDPSTQTVIAQMLDHPPAEAFADPTTMLGIGVAALVILQSYFKVERDKSGRWTFKIEKQPLNQSLLKDVIAKLGGWMSGALK